MKFNIKKGDLIEFKDGTYRTVKLVYKCGKDTFVTVKSVLKGGDFDLVPRDVKTVWRKVSTNNRT